MSNCRNKAVKLNRHLVVKTDVMTQPKQPENIQLLKIPVWTVKDKRLLELQRNEI